MKKAKNIIKELSESEVKAVALELVKAVERTTQCFDCTFRGCDLTPRTCKVKILKAAMDNAGVLYNWEETI